MISLSPKKVFSSSSSLVLDSVLHFKCNNHLIVVLASVKNYHLAQIGGGPVGGGRLARQWPFKTLGSLCPTVAGPKCTFTILPKQGEGGKGICWLSINDFLDIVHPPSSMHGIIVLTVRMYG